MTTETDLRPIKPSTTVGEIINTLPEAMELFQRYQAGTRGLCVISREISLETLCQRFDVPVSETIDTLESLKSN
ncbi:MAG: hypothetical protein ABEK50_01670 [bacterium]